MGHGRGNKPHGRWFCVRRDRSKPCPRSRRRSERQKKRRLACIEFARWPAVASVRAAEYLPPGRIMKVWSTGSGGVELMVAWCVPPSPGPRSNMVAPGLESLLRQSPMRLNRTAFLAVEIALFAALVAFMYFGVICALTGMALKAWHWVAG